MSFIPYPSSLILVFRIDVDPVERYYFNILSEFEPDPDSKYLILRLGFVPVVGVGRDIDTSKDIFVPNKVINVRIDLSGTAFNDLEFFNYWVNWFFYFGFSGHIFNFVGPQSPEETVLEIGWIEDLDSIQLPGVELDPRYFNGWYESANKVIYIEKFTETNTIILEHELGHYLSLLDFEDTYRNVMNYNMEYFREAVSLFQIATINPPVQNLVIPPEVGNDRTYSYP